MVTLVTYVNDCEHEPVEQVRKDMRQGDYFDAVTNSLDEPRWARLSDHYHEEVELGPHNATDARIVCRKCFLSTGWMKVDFPGAPPGLGIAAVRAKWDGIKQYDVEEYAAIQRSRAVKSKIIKLGDDGVPLVAQ